MSNFNGLSEVGERSREKRVTRKTKGKWEEAAGKMERGWRVIMRAGTCHNVRAEGGSKRRGLKTGHTEAEPQCPRMLAEKKFSAFA